MEALEQLGIDIAAPIVASNPPQDLTDDPLTLRIRNFAKRPDIYLRRAPNSEDIATELDVTVPDWTDLRRRRELEMLQQYGAHGMIPGTRIDISLRPIAKTMKTHKGKGNGRTYTSRYRGVHQTFPTRRWEAQFRRNGKPTSLGCFDQEEEAARAYDKMMLWCELHHPGGVKGGVTNFLLTEYDGDIHWLHQVTQDELVQILRSDGRKQAAARVMRQKKEQHGVGPSAGAAAEARQRQQEAAMGEGEESYRSGGGGDGGGGGGGFFMHVVSSEGPSAVASSDDDDMR